MKELRAEAAAMEYARLAGRDENRLSPFVFAAHPVRARVGGEYDMRSIRKVEAGGANRSSAGLSTRGRFSPSPGPEHQEFRAIAAGRGIERRMIPCSAIVRTGANRLRRIVQNLVSNAVRYTLSGRAVIGCRRSGDALRIDVRVTGVGMGEKDTNTIFEEFRRLENSQTVGEQGGGALTRPIRPAALRALLTWAARQRGDIAGA